MARTTVSTVLLLVPGRPGTPGPDGPGPTVEVRKETLRHRPIVPKVPDGYVSKRPRVWAVGRHRPSCPTPAAPITVDFGTVLSVRGGTL